MKSVLTFTFAISIDFKIISLRFSKNLSTTSSSFSTDSNIFLTAEIKEESFKREEVDRKVWGVGDKRFLIDIISLLSIWFSCKHYEQTLWSFTFLFRSIKSQRNPEWSVHYSSKIWFIWVVVMNVGLVSS